MAKCGEKCCCGDHSGENETLRLNNEENVTEVSAGKHKSIFHLSGLDCADCAAKLEQKISRLQGVDFVTVNFATGNLIVDHEINDSEIVQAVEKSGYKVLNNAAGQPLQHESWRKDTRTRLTIIAGITLFAAAVLNWLGSYGVAATVLYAVTILTAGYHPAKSGLYGVKSFVFDMNFLMTAAIIGAAAIGEWSEGATVAFLFSLGNTLQTYTMDKTRSSIRGLMQLAPPEATIYRNGVPVKIPVDQVAVGDVSIVRPGERIAVDGKILHGRSSVNQAAITGESMPVEKAAGDTVFAGTINGYGALEIQATKPAADSTLARIIRLVEEAQEQKAPAQQYVDRFAKYYTPLVLLAAAGVILTPCFIPGQSFSPWFYKGLVLLVISCPCALVISTPVSIVSAIGNASREGLLIKGGAHLEKIGVISAVAFDKTGTLTAGKPVVTDILPLRDMDENELIITAAAIEKLSEHPLAYAVLERAGEKALPSVIGFQAIPGRGAKADLDGRTLYIGNSRLFEELGHSSGIPEAEALERQGKTVIAVGDQTEIFGIITVADTERTGAEAAISRLRLAGMEHIAMLTGDNNRVAGAVAEKLKLDEFYSDLLPEDKVDAVKKIRDKYGSVIMVGDGINDAPALALADVGVAMGVAGSDAALDTADVALMADDLSKIEYMVKLSRKTLMVIKQNIAFAILVKAVFVVLAFAGLANLWMAVFADTGASLLVTANGMRLMRRLEASAV